MQQLKTRFPDKTEASVLAEPNTPYDQLVQVMDAVRVSASRTARQTVRDRALSRHLDRRCAGARRALTG